VYVDVGIIVAGCFVALFLCILIYLLCAKRRFGREDAPIPNIRVDQIQTSAGANQLNSPFDEPGGPTVTFQIQPTAEDLPPRYSAVVCQDEYYGTSTDTD
jgi:hypothetical protein